MGLATYVEVRQTVILHITDHSGETDNQLVQLADVGRTGRCNDIRVQCLAVGLGAVMENTEALCCRRSFLYAGRQAKQLSGYIY
jgi:hypothetical protein